MEGYTTSNRNLWWMERHRPSQRHQQSPLLLRRNLHWSVLVITTLLLHFTIIINNTLVNHYCDDDKHHPYSYFIIHGFVRDSTFSSRAFSLNQKQSFVRTQRILAFDSSTGSSSKDGNNIIPDTTSTGYVDDENDDILTTTTANFRNQIQPSEQTELRTTRKDISSNNNNPDTDDGGDDDGDFSAWIVSNLQQWPLLNIESASSSTSAPLLDDQLTQPPLPTTTTMFDNTSNSSMISKSSSSNNVWNDVATLLLQSTISSSLLSFGNASSPSDTTSNTITSYLRSPLSQVFNVEAILPLLTSPTTKNKENNVNASNDSMVTTNTVTSSVESSSSATPSPSLADSILKQATARIEAIVTEASTVVSSDTVMTLINKASELVRLSSSSTTTTTPSSTTSPATALPGTTSSITPIVIDSQSMNSKIEPLPPSIVRESVTTYATSILRIADGLLRKGYVGGDIVAKKFLKGRDSMLKDIPIVTDSQALFNEYRSVKEINSMSHELIKSTEMGALAGAIYEETIPRTHALRQTIVARGTSADVTWMISDSVANHTSFTTTMDAESRHQPFLVRTITIRGFDASDESVDREQLLNQICTATPVQLWNNTSQQQQQQLLDIRVHGGLLSIARVIYADIKQYIDWTASSHKIVLNGHSVGGSISILLLMLMIQDYGIEYVRKNIIQVYTFGSPPVVVMRDSNMNVMSALNVPAQLIQGFVQPWDPIVRLFSEIDALYPLASDLGPDNITPFANGPTRALRPILKSILVSWAGWPRFRDNFKGTAKQSYKSIGVQHIILPEPTRYLADRFLAVNIPVPPVETIVQISSDELYHALSTIFPLDVFEVSYVPQAIRSFVHHFYPAYGFPLVDYGKELQRRSRGLPERKSEFAFSEDKETTTSGTTTIANDGGIDWGKATKWLTRNDSKS